MLINRKNNISKKNKKNRKNTRKMRGGKTCEYNDYYLKCKKKCEICKKIFSNKDCTTKRDKCKKMCCESSKSRDKELGEQYGILINEQEQNREYKIEAETGLRGEKRLNEYTLTSECDKTICVPINYFLPTGSRIEKLKIRKEPLGKGSFNATYDIGNNLVFRLTHDGLTKWELNDEIDGLMYQSVLGKQKEYLGEHCRNICQVYDYGYYRRGAESGVYAILEKITGGTLEDGFWRLVEEKGDYYSAEQARLLIKNLLETLDDMHNAGYIHLDLKLENIMLEKEDDYSNIKVIDFGMTKKMENGYYVTEQTRKKTIYLGTPLYGSPEIVKSFNQGGNIKINGKADIWCLGKILLCILTGYFYDDTSEICAELPENIYENVYKLEECHYDYIMEKFGKDGDLIVDFIKKTQEEDPEKRPSALELLKHKWIIGKSGGKIKKNRKYSKKKHYKKI